MSLVQVPNGIGVPLFPLQSILAGSTLRTTTTTFTLDAAGESVAFIGRLYLSSGPGTSKVLSSAGGKVFLRAGSSITFANGGTNLRVGIQDVTAGGVNDDSWAGEPQADLVGGTDTITAASVLNVPIESGSRTIAHGDMLAVVAEMTTRAGADTVGFTANPIATGAVDLFNFPYSAADTGSGPVISANQTDIMGCVIIFDDGTIGVLGYDSFPVVLGANTFNSGSTPDEYALIFQVPFRCSISGILGVFEPTNTSANFELILYSDPLGTPTVVDSITVVAAKAGAATTSFCSDYPLTVGAELTPGVDYAIALRPTTANDITVRILSLGTGNAAIRGALGLGAATMYQATRTNNTGAFGSADTVTIPLLGIRVRSFDDGAGSSTPASSGEVQPGSSTTLVQDGVYSLPNKVINATVITSSGSIEISLDGNTWQAITLDSNKNFTTSAPFIRSVSGDSTIIAKAF